MFNERYAAPPTSIGRLGEKFGGSSGWTCQMQTIRYTPIPQESCGTPLTC